MQAAFLTGKPTEAYHATMRALAHYSDLYLEAARLRFRVNFASSVCEKCDGLKAGPGVVATCYQLQRCEYSNTKETDIDSEQARVIEALTP